MNEAEKMFSLIYYNLYCQSPVMSGNMRSQIKEGQNKKNEFVIVIDAPFYDIDEWRRTKTIVHTGENINGQTAYASDVNQFGGFKTRNKSMHWVNRVCVEIATQIASEIGAEVINELEL